MNSHDITLIVEAVREELDKHDAAAAAQQVKLAEAIATGMLDLLNRSFAAHVKKRHADE